MYEDFIANLPISEKKIDKFMVKGVRLPLYKADNTILQLIGNYYFKREDFVFFSPSYSGKLKAILEIKNILPNTVIISDNRHADLHECVEDVSKFNFNDISVEFVIFYNVPVPSNLPVKNVHISCFYDYIELYNPDDFKEYIEKRVPTTRTFTIICKPPRKKQVEFLFGTNNTIKHLSIRNEEENVFIYSKESPKEQIARYFESNKLAIIKDIYDGFKANKLIFYDIDIESVKKSLKTVDKICLVYTKDDFQDLKVISNLLIELGIEVQENIKNLLK